MAAKVERFIQFGEGGFLRGFVDDFIHRLNQSALFEGSIVIVQPLEKGMVEAMATQDYRYNLFLRGIQNGQLIEDHQVIDDISRGINPYHHYQDFIQLATQDDLDIIISNTTEAGIEFKDEAYSDHQCAMTFPGKLTQLMFERFKLGKKGYILLPCELIDRNADQLKEMVLKYGEAWNLGEAFKQWVLTQNTFSNTLVDRIVTGYPKDNLAEFTAKLGFEDHFIDTAEIFHLWVIEGNHEQILPFNKANIHVLWTDNVDPYKKRKVRILNGAHTSLVPFAMLKGKTTVGECMEDPEILAFLKACIYDEIIETLDLSHDELIEFADRTLERFKNPTIQHLLSSIALNSYDKFKVRVMPSILEYKERFGKYPPHLMQAFEAFYAFYQTNLVNDAQDKIEFVRTHTQVEVFEALCK